MRSSSGRMGHATRCGRTAVRGQTLIEFALILPVLLLVIFSAIDFGRAVATYNALANATRQSAHYAQAHNVKTCVLGDGQNLCEPVRDTALAVSPLLASSAVSLTVNYQASMPNAIFDPISGVATLRSWTVSMSYTFYPIISHVFPKLSLPFTSTAQVVGD